MIQQKNRKGRLAIPLTLLAFGALLSSCPSPVHDADPSGNVEEPTPGPVITGLTSSASPVRSVEWTWSAEAEGVQFRFSINTDSEALESELGDWETTTSASVTEGDGWRYLHIQARDAQGNTSPLASYSALLDNTPPSTFSINVQSPTKQKRPTWGWGADSDRTAYQVSFDPTMGWMDIGSSLSYTPIEDLATGEQTLYVRATDTAGNWSSAIGKTVLIEKEVLPWQVLIGDALSSGALYAIAPSAGGVLVAGESSISGGAGGMDGVATLFAPDGNQTWKLSYGGASADSFYSACDTADGGFLLAGSTWSFGSDAGANADAMLIKTDSLGAVEWAKSYGMTGSHDAFRQCLPVQAGYLAVGTSGRSDGGKEILVALIDENGELVWVQTIYSGFVTQPRRGYSALELSDGYAIGADKNSSMGAARESYILKLSKTDGSILWQRQLDKVAEGTPALQSLALSADGTTIWAAGTNEWDAIAVPINPATGDIASGKFPFKFLMGASQPDSHASLVCLSDGGMLMVSTQKGSPNTYLWAARLSATGAVQWQARYGGQTGNALGFAALETADNQIYLAGSDTDPASTKTNCWLLSPDTLTGTLDGYGTATFLAKLRLESYTSSEISLSAVSRIAVFVSSDISASLSVAVIPD
ncbi:MAG: hypothetical protein JW923_06110 [Spirochaetales bacterium]|nr:hypothetical protein [Spirochaetales bacterium]